MSFLNESRRDIAFWSELRYYYVHLHSTLAYRSPNEIETKLLGLVEAA